MVRISELPQKFDVSPIDVIPLVDMTSDVATITTKQATLQDVLSAFLGKPNGAASLDNQAQLEADQFPTLALIDGGNF
jgi:hypothetical protein